MSVQIITGDCREILPTLQADVLISDPVWPNCPPDLIAGSDRPYELLRELLEVVPASVKRLVLVMRSDSDPRILSAVPRRWPFVCMQALPYAVPMYVGRVLGVTEIAYGFGTPIASAPGRKVIPMWAPKAQPANRKAIGHPCSRALVHMDWLVNWWSEPGEIVVDPFCGSGTIPLAADRMQRHGIGIEIDPEYADLARSRAAHDAGMFAKAAPIVIPSLPTLDPVEGGVG